MKNKFFIATLIALLSITIIPNDFMAKAEAQRIDVYLIGGQSNAVGYGHDNLIENGYTDARFINGFTNILFYGDYETDKSCPTDFVPVKKGLGKNWTNGTAGSGAELGIASMLGDSDGAVAVIKCAYGATYLAPDTVDSVSKSQGTWTPPSYIKDNNIKSDGTLIGNMYRRFVSTVTDGLNKLKAKGYKPVIKGMWWMQGEAESNSAINANAYFSLLKSFIKDLRLDLSTVTGIDQSAMPFVLGKIYRNPDAQYSQPTFIEVVRAAQQKAADEIFNIFSVDCYGLKQQDGWHFRADEQVWLGQQFVSAVLESEGKRQVSLEGSHVSATGLGIKTAGENVSITFKPNRGYKIVSVTYRETGGQPHEITLIDGKYSFIMSDANVFFTVSAENLPIFRLIEYTVNDKNMGSIFPSAEAKNGWYEGENVSVAVIPREGFCIASVSINGNQAQYASEDRGTFYYTLNQTENVFINVNFAAALPPDDKEDDKPTEKNGCDGTVTVSASFPILLLFIVILMKNNEMNTRLK